MPIPEKPMSYIGMADSARWLKLLRRHWWHLVLVGAFLEVLRRLLAGL